MPTTLTLENIPDEVFERLEASAASHERSLTSEAVACLEVALHPAKARADEFLARARRIRESSPATISNCGEIDAYKREGRE